MKYILTFNFLFLFTFFVKAQTVPDSLKENQRVNILLENGSHKKGYLVFENDTEIKIWSEEIGFYRISKDKIRKIEYVKIDTKIRNGLEESDYIHHNAFTNSALAPRKGELYIRAPLFSSACLDLGITDNLTIGLDAFYFVAMNLNARYKFNLSENTKFSLASGVYYSYLAGGFGPRSTLYSQRAVFTFGGNDKNISLGGIYLTNFKRMEIGVITLSGMLKMNDKNKLLIDILVAPDIRSLNVDATDFSFGFFGIRHQTRKGNRLDLGLANLFFNGYYYSYPSGYVRDRFFMPIPYVQMAFKL